MVPPTFDARVVATRSLSPSVREIAFERADGTPFEFEPGQWVSLLLPSPDGEIRRAYSVASAPRHDATFEIAVTRVAGGAGSQALHSLLPGQTVRVIGPQGFFTRPVAAPPALFIGTGTGLAPLRSMLHAGAIGAPVWLLFGARTEDDLLYRDELATLAQSHPGVRIMETLSQAGEAWGGRRGYVQAHARAIYEELTAATHEQGAAPHVYVCGLERMVSAVRALFRQEMGLARQLVHSERYD